MKYLVNGTLRTEKTREELVAKIGERNKLLSGEAWELVRRDIVTEHGFKIGARPGIILIVRGDSEESVKAALSQIPLLREGWFDIEIDPISPFLSDIR
jgi:hypothetical protein